MQLTDRIKTFIRDVPDFPKPGIMFKDITPLLEQPQVVQEVVELIAEEFKASYIDAVASIEARGFLFGFMIAQKLEVPFVPVRKEGKLPYRKITQHYALEYGEAAVEMHEDAIRSGWRVLVHDDLLATGGTAHAAGQLIKRLGGEVTGFSFLINLGFLGGDQLIRKYYNCNPHYLIEY